MKTKLRTQIKRLILVFITGLVLSGPTAFPIEWQLGLAHRGIHYLQWNNMDLLQ